MTYGNLDSGYIRFAPRKLIIGENTVYNPTDDQYLELGWKPCVFSDMPETEIGYHAEERWADDGENLVQSWKIEQDPPDADIDDAEAYNIIFGGGEA